MIYIEIFWNKHMQGFKLFQDAKKSIFIWFKSLGTNEKSLY